MRHGEAEAYKTNDASRALTKTGRAAVASKAQFIPDIDRLVVSPYLRALQSADILVEQGVNVKHRIVDERILPDCALAPIVEHLLNGNEGVQLLVAHNPLLSYLTQFLCGDGSHSIALNTANLVCLEGESFYQGTAQLQWIK